MEKLVLSALSNLSKVGMSFFVIKKVIQHEEKVHKKAHQFLKLDNNFFHFPLNESCLKLQPQTLLPKQK